MMITIVITRADTVNMKNLGKRLKHAREKSGLSQRELAKASGVSQGMISQIEAGNKEGGLSTLEKLSEGLGISFEALYRPEGRADTDPGLLSGKLVYEIAKTVTPMTVRERREVLRFCENLRKKK